MAKFSKTEAMKAVLEEDRFDVDDPEVAKKAAEKYIQYVEEGHPDDGESLLEFTCWEAKQGTDESEAKPTDDMRNYNPKATMRAEGVASREATKYEEDKLIADGGTRSYVENARDEIEEVDESVQNTDWNAVQLHIKNELRNGMWQNDYLIEEMKGIIDNYAQYSYNEQQKMEFINEIIDYVSNEEAETITHKIISKMSIEEAENKELNEESVSSSIKETFKEEVSKGATRGAVSAIADKIGMGTLMAIASALGGAIAGVPIF